MFETFEHFLYTAYAGDTTFFVNSQTSVIEILKVLTIFQKISGLKPNKSKCEMCSERGKSGTLQQCNAST